ncbi:MAG: MBL fold metallo-hydrolase [Bacteroidetes bacterium B1(2017)]|nr:MAG: MBL fold metallo-hydrolase [Bacteroidetes bacterium B1(2017)]
MKVTFLGTGTSQGVPIIACDCEICSSSEPKDKRLRSSIMLEHNGKTIVVDSGPDFRTQMLQYKVKELDALLFTHAHRDHMAGLDDIRGFNFRMKRAIDVYCEKRVEAAIRKEFYYAFEEPKYPGVPEMNMHQISLTPFELFGLPIIPIQVWHHKMPVLGFRFNDFVYITDANRIDASEKAKIKGCKVLVLNALRRETHISHFTLDEAIELAKELEVETAYFTHISHQLGLHYEVEQELPSNMHLAYDGMELHF